MAGMQRRWWIGLVIMVGGLASSPAVAGPYFGEWSWCWRPAPECSRGDYSRLHYWAPELYKVRAWILPSQVDQYPPGASPPVAASTLLIKSPCQSAPSAATPPYADPAGYYGIAIAPPPE